MNTSPPFETLPNLDLKILNVEERLELYYLMSAGLEGGFKDDNLKKNVLDTYIISDKYQTVTSFIDRAFQFSQTEKRTNALDAFGVTRTEERFLILMQTAPEPLSVLKQLIQLLQNRLSRNNNNLTENF
ncbi:hypothetical protein ACQU0X_26615 [Pseudovibrio ascidiaceicola]|uniref:hypothetical protein n=1 Tax=Pseudovibrio ascidiaceicola TaxID=285279 RepID=UPI003D3692F4